ncbi:MAG: recombinase family protein [Lysobacterales bacterium]|jgi:DNA invertase Pin-like site-specific DNA recombinase|nr:MAG: recombinase family protein [Xanthomonadales bacterium]
MRDERGQKVSASHLKRNAYLYVRQSSLRQVFENTESTERQYALRQQAIALGWPVEQVIVIDTDLGHSGASAVDREGFQRLVAEVGLGKAGIVLGLEVSRLARNSSDWHRLLEICALSDTLIADEDGVYDPAHFNDRLLLGLKGTMSEAELHVLKARLQGGLLNKARRGELALPLPVGLVYNAQNRVILDPDQRVRETLAFFFQTYRRTGSATATVKAFREQDLLFPRRLRGGPNKGELVWGLLAHSRALQVLHNPRYAGAFVFGRTRQRRTPQGHTSVRCQPEEEWLIVPDMHPGYLSWEDYQLNGRRLRECAQALGADRRKSPPREGPALLQGLVVCGICGSRMTLRYHLRRCHPVPDYMCQGEGIQHGEPVCQQVPGAAIDQAIGELLVSAMTPLALDVALAVQQELQSRIDEADQLRRKQVEQARYEADLARRRYLHVDPANRLVADSLEADWNDKLRQLSDAQVEYERQRENDRLAITDEHRARIAALANDFPRLWQDPDTPDRERKRMARLLIEDVTLIKRHEITVHVRFKGGATQTLTLPPPRCAWELRMTPAEVIAEIDRLLDHYTEGQIAIMLNQRGLRSGEGKPFHSRLVARIRHTHGLKPRYDRLRETGMYTIDEMTTLLGVCTDTVKKWGRHGLLLRHAYTDKNAYLYEHPGDHPPTKSMGSKLSRRRRFPILTPIGSREVQCEA